MQWIVGVDGCPAGWIAAFAPLDDLAAPRIRVVPRFADIIDAPEAPSVIAVDMPMGLPERIEGAGRAPERLVRSLLGKGASSVFSMCSRRAVYAGTYEDAKRIAFDTSSPGRMMTIQAFNIMRKIIEIDQLLQARPELVNRVFESHPEVIFHTLNGASNLAHPKKTPDGKMLRRALLAASGVGQDCLVQKPPQGAAVDDQIDALACLVTAQAIAVGAARSFPSPPERDQNNIPIAIWAPAAHKR